MADTDARAQELAWVRAVQRRDDRGAFAQLVRRHQGPLRALLRRLCSGDAAVADELAQETFLAAYRALSTFRGDSAFRTWLFRIAHNAFLQHRRRGAQRLRELERELRVEAEDIAMETNPHRLARSVALGHDLQRALAQLTEAERCAVVYCHMADFSHSEAAAILGWPLGTVKTHVSRGTAKLRASLAAWAPVGETSS